MILQPCDHTRTCCNLQMRQWDNLMRQLVRRLHSTFVLTSIIIIFFIIMRYHTDSIFFLNIFFSFMTESIVESYSHFVNFVKRYWRKCFYNSRYDFFIDLGKLGNFKKISKMLRIRGKRPPDHLKLNFALENCKNSPLQHFPEKAILLNFENLSTMFCQDCLRKYIFTLNSSQTPWNLQFLQILNIRKLLLLLQLIFIKTEFWHTPKFNIFQKALFFTLP